MGHSARHLPVLFSEALDGLAIDPSGIYIDGTFGRGGHSEALLDALGDKGRLLAIDKDPEAVAHGRTLFESDGRFQIKQGSFAMLEQFANQEGLVGGVNGILLDLGVSSPQLDTPERGFSFLKDGPLDMRMDNASGISAAQWLARAEVDDIAQVLKEYGEERHAKRIARAIHEAGQLAPIETTGRLAEIVSVANPAWEKGKHPATRAFQGIRIFINRELDDLRSCLDQSL
ncbi:MAG: 16S rRNA (cytosine(1402)-N(4))-methyltransferase RsmH, partial [Candidatus Sedimenticola sp. (ex Thyasira tokunagai)]